MADPTQSAPSHPPAPPAGGAVPQHVAVIMDGNGRWAQGRGLPRLKGHEEGAESVRAVLAAAQRHGIRYLTLYAFSVENWRRPAEEVSGLMRLLVYFLGRHAKELHERKTRLRVLGRRSDLPKAVAQALSRVEAETAGYAERTLVLALSYGGRTEIAHAAREIARQVREGSLCPEEVTEATVAAYLYLPDLPDPDLIIRTSGELRLSNFLLWQSAYSEFYCTPVLWPDFREAAFEEALNAFRVRQRRFGGLGGGRQPPAGGGAAC